MIDSKEEKLRNTNEPKILGIGGIFFKSSNPNILSDWYMKNLGFTSQIKYTPDDNAINFRWKTIHDVPQTTVWAPFKVKTDYFSPSKKDFMINFIVNDLESFLHKLIQNGVQQVGNIQTFDYGKFAWILDPEGNKIELWEPTQLGREGIKK
ncbi:MAG: VOC family protein [Candidatus Thorarchaeota archaeon]